jgi:hypothetical protein
MEELNKKIEITDEEALGILSKGIPTKSKLATKFVTRTIIYPVTVYYKPNVPTNELRTAVRMGEYCSPGQWERALELEKKYAKLNKQFVADLKARKLPVSMKEPGNPLKATVINLS